MGVLSAILGVVAIFSTAIAIYFYRQSRGLIEAQQEIARLQEKISNETKRLEDWDKAKQEHMNITQASLAEIGVKLSNKLLDDHKREAESAKKENEKKIKETTEELHNKFQKVFGSMDSLTNQIKDLEVLRQAMLTPTGAGNLGEITLENILKASRLIKNKDYFLQYTLEGPEGKLLKPDAVISLPGNNLLIVDSKASKFFLEISDSATNPEQTKAARANLKKSMNEHLKGLVVRDYKYAFEQRRIADKALGELGDITMLMFLPSDAVLDKLHEIDPQFIENAWEEHILPVGPTGLVVELRRSKIKIDSAKAEESVREIRSEVKNLLNSVAILHEKAGDLGRSIEGSFKKYDAFAASFNRTFLSQAKKLAEHGISTSKDRALPKLERYQFIKSDLEGSAQEIEDRVIQKLEEIK